VLYPLSYEGGPGVAGAIQSLTGRHARSRPTLDRSTVQSGRSTCVAEQAAASQRKRRVRAGSAGSVKPRER
jgi:hypothetical protein